MQVIEEFAGVLPFTDKSSPEVIKRETGLSKMHLRERLEDFIKSAGLRSMKNRSVKLINSKAYAMIGKIDRKKENLMKKSSAQTRLRQQSDLIHRQSK